jgi:thioredoxin reductase
MPKAEPLRVAVLGAGPVGVEAAVYARACGLTVGVYERGQAGEHLLRWGHVRMFTPFGMNASPLGLQTLHRERPARDLPAETDIITGRQFRDGYLAPLADSEPLRGSIHVQHAVLRVGRSASVKKSDPDDGRRPFRLLVRDAAGHERIDTADVVLDCSGTFAIPNWLGDGNIPAIGEAAARPHLAHATEDVLGTRKDHYAGRSIVLIGDGYSAATTICQLATLAEDHPATWVFWVTRGARGQPLPRLPNDPLKERDRLAVKANSLATRCDGNLEFHPQTLFDEVICHGPDKGFRVAGRSNGKPVSWDVERVIANVGYRPDLSVCESLRVDPPAGRPETREPGYFLLGTKSYGRDSGFLLRDGFDQIRGVFAAITGNPRLDLYAKKAA